jgi:hypothetical protein
MTVQHIELGGERYVILPEREFEALARSSAGRTPSDSAPLHKPAPAGVPVRAATKFHAVVPLQVAGTPASEILLRDRR